MLLRSLSFKEREGETKRDPEREREKGRDTCASLLEECVMCFSGWEIAHGLSYIVAGSYLV